jgi:hypothetical protein
MTTSGPVYVIRLRSLRGSNIIGLRHVLKRLGRSFGFKCLSAVEEKIQEFPPERE